VPVAEPARIRALDGGQVAYIDRGGVTYVQVKRLVAAPAAVPPVPVAAVRPAAEPASTAPVGLAPARASGGVSAAELSDVSSLLDAAFGPGP
jgi:hypothetical protein